MRQMSDVFAKASVFSFTTAESFELIGPSGERRVLHFFRSVTIRRPNAMFFELHGSAGTALDVAAYYDGRTVTLRGDANKVWAQATVPGTLDDMLDDVSRRYSLPVPFADVAYSAPHEAFIGPATTGGFTGRETIDGVQCVALMYSDALLDLRIWIPSSGQPLPRRVEIGYKQVRDVPKAVINFTNWNLQALATDAMFAFQPVTGFTRIELPEFVAGLLEGGQPSASAASAAAVPGGEIKR